MEPSKKMKTVFVKTYIFLGSLLCVSIIGGNSSLAQSSNQQECSQQYLSSLDQNLPDAIALTDDEDLPATIERNFGCNVLLSKFTPLSSWVNLSNGETFGTYKSLGYNSKTQEFGAFIEMFPEYSADNNVVVIPYDMIGMWTSKGANVMVSRETISELPSTEDWIQYGDELRAQNPLPYKLLQVVFRPPSMSFIIFNSVPSGANIFVSDKLIGNTKVQGYLKDQKHDAVRFEMMGFKDCDLSSGAVVKRSGDQPDSFECNLSAVSP